MWCLWKHQFPKGGNNHHSETGMNYPTSTEIKAIKCAMILAEPCENNAKFQF